MWNHGAVTDIGRTVLAKAAGGKTLVIDGAQSGTGTVAETELRTSTSLAGTTYVLGVTNYEVKEEGVCFTVQITSPGDGYTAKQIGLFGHVDNEDSCLLAIYQDETGIAIPDNVQMPDFMYLFYAEIQMNNSGIISITLDPSVLVSQRQLQEAIRNTMPSYINDWLDEHVMQETGYVIDDSLTVPGAAADAKATGDALDALNGRVSTLEEELGFALYPAWVAGSYTSYGYQDTTARKRTDKLPAGRYSAAINADYVLSAVEFVSDTRGINIVKSESGGRYYFESDSEIILNTRRADNTSIAAMTDAEINAIWQLKGEPITGRVAELGQEISDLSDSVQDIISGTFLSTHVDNLLTFGMPTSGYLSDTGELLTDDAAAATWDYTTVSADVGYRLQMRIPKSDLVGGIWHCCGLYDDEKQWLERTTPVQTADFEDDTYYYIDHAYRFPFEAAYIRVSVRGYGFGSAGYALVPVSAPFLPDPGEEARDLSERVDTLETNVADTQTEVSRLKSSISDSQGNIIPSAELKSAVDAISTVTLGENLANPETVTVGSLTSTGGVDSSATGYKTFDYIALEANTDYTLTSWRMDTGALVTSRKHVALYDSTKAFISGSYQNVNGASSVAFNSGTSAKYARVSVGGTNNAFVAKGSTAPTAFVEYTKTYSTDMIVENYKAGSISSEALSAGLHNELLHKGAINLYEAQSAVVGILTLTGNVDTTGTNYLTSDFIPIKQGFTYTVSPICRRKCFYSAINMGAFVSADNTQYNAPHSFVAAFTGYLRFSFSNSASDVSCIETFSGTVTEKIEEGVSLSETQKAQVSALIEDTANLGYDVLYGKKWAVCGDSFTNSGGTGTTMPAGAKYAGNPYTYPWIIGSRQNMDIIKFFEGGRTLAFPEEPGTFANSLTNPNATWYYQNIPADVDYITIYLGINDEHHSSASSGGDGEDNTGIIPIGTIDDNTTATYLGAWNVVLTWLITNRPNAHIGIIVTNGIPLKDEYRLGQIAIAQKYGIPYIDLNGDTRTPAMLRTSNPNIPTNIKQALIEKWSANYPSNQHPNDAAQLFESSFIENFLRSI